MYSFSFITSVIITTVLYLSDALRKNFLNENFDYKVSVHLAGHPAWVEAFPIGLRKLPFFPVVMYSSYLKWVLGHIGFNFEY